LQSYSPPPSQSQINVIKAEGRSEELAKAKEQAEKLRDLRDKALSSELDSISDFYEMRNLKNEETLNKALSVEKDAKKREQLIRDASF